MKRDLLDILCCPVCKGDLCLEEKTESADEILEGGLVCEACGVRYPIEEGIPDLLPRSHGCA